MRKTANGLGWWSRGVALAGILAASTGHAYVAATPIIGTGHATRPDWSVSLERPMGQSWNPIGNTFYDEARALALSEFVLTADEGDHHVERLGAEANRQHDRSRFARVSFNHRTTCWYGAHPTECRKRDPFPYTFRIGMVLPTEADSYWTTEATVESCAGSCVVKMPLGRAGYRFLLSGFRFERPTSEAYVRRISVMPEPNGDVRVRFQDNGNPTFKAEVSGLWVPASFVDGTLQDETVVYTPGETPPKIEVGHGPYALVGFDLEFTNGDHKLRTIGLRYTAPFLAPKLADQNSDDPWRARVRWVKLAS